MKIAGIESAVPQIRKIDAIWVGSELGCAETLKACAEKVGFCTRKKPLVPKRALLSDETVLTA